MVAVGRKNLTRDKGRLAISVGGVAFAVLLMLFLQGTYSGTLAQATAYVDNAGADLWIAQEGITDMFHSQSILPAGQEEQLRVAGVMEVRPLLGRAVHAELASRSSDLFVVGYDPAGTLGGPWRIHAGADAPGPGEIIVDRVFATNNDVDIGDDLVLLEEPFRIAGIARGASTLFNSFAFLNLEDAARLSQVDGAVNYYLIATDGTTRPADLEGIIPDSVVYTRAEFAANNGRNAQEAFLPIIASTMVIGLLIGTVVVALTVYTATMEKRSEYGVLKAVGAKDGFLYRIILSQSLISAVLGMVVGIGVTYGVRALVEFLVPEMSIQITLLGLALVAAASLAISVLAALLPIRRIAKLDPGEVFRV